MAKHVISDVDVSLTIGGTEYDLANRIRSISFTRTAAEVDCTNFRSDGAMERLAGLFDGSVDIDWQADFATDSVFDVLKNALATKITLKVDPTAGSMADEGVVEVLVTELPLFDGAVGELSTFSTSWPFSDSSGAMFDQGALWTATMLVGTHATQDRKGFDRNSGARWGRLTTDDFAPAGALNSTTNQDSRIISLFLDQSEDALYLRVNRKQDFRGKWIRVGPDWLEMHPESGGHGFTSGDGAETASYDITAAAGWRDAIDNWTELTILPVGVYDRQPDGVLPTTPNLLATLTMTVGNVGNEHGYKDDPGGYGAISGGGDFTALARDGEITLEELSFDTGTNTLTFDMENSGDATRVNGLWLAVRPDATSAYNLAVQVDAGTSASLAFVNPQPTTDPGWTGTQLVEFWDRDPR